VKKTFSNVKKPAFGPDVTVSQLLQLLSPFPSTAARAVAVALSEVNTPTGWMILATLPWLDHAKGNLKKSSTKHSKNSIEFMKLRTIY